MDGHIDGTQTPPPQPPPKNPPNQKELYYKAKAKLKEKNDNILPQLNE